MKVYILEGVIDYEGFRILGVFRSRALAEKAERESRQEREERGLFPFDSYDVEEHELQE